MRDSMLAACAMSARSITSCTELEDNMPNPVARVAMTSLWSPKIESAWMASDRAAMWNTVGVSSPAILYMLGIISSSPCAAVNVVQSAPACKAPWSAATAPPSLCISITVGTVPQMLVFPSADHWSAHSPMLEDGVMG